MIDSIRLTPIQIARIAAWVEQGEGMAEVTIEQESNRGDAVRVTQGDASIGVSLTGVTYE